MDGTIQYLNTDLDLRSRDDLSSLTSALESRGVSALHSAMGDDGLWHGTFETDESFDEPDANIAAMLDAIESLASELRATWFRCELREFNIGYDCGDQPWAFNQGLRSEILGRMAAAGASLRFTLYPDRPDVATNNSESQ